MQKSVRNNFVLPDQFLDEQICSQCKKYLSCGPVKTYSSGGIYEVRCGRCVSDNDGGFVSTFNKLFENAFFPCVNRLEGCNSLVSYKDMKAHEGVCRGTNIACPACSPKGTPTYSLMALISHFKCKHSKNFLTNPVYTIKKNVETYYLFHDLTKHLLVLLHIKFDAQALLIKTRSSLKTVLKHTIYNSSVPSDGTEIYSSDFLTGQSLGDVAKELRIPMIVIGSCERLQGKIEVDLVAQTMQCIEIAELGALTNESVETGRLVEASCSVENPRRLPKRTFRNIHRDQYYEEFSRNFEFSSDLTSITNLQTGEEIPIVCHFCENLIFEMLLKFNYYFCITCGFSLCFSCHKNINNGVVPTYCLKCFSNSISLETSTTCTFYNVNFDCNFNCGHYDKDWGRLSQHESGCELNQYKGLTEEELIKQYFGVMKTQNDRFHQSNCILIDPIRTNLLKKGKIYVVTTDDVQFIVNGDYDQPTQAIKFRVSHEYDHVTVHTKVCQKQTYYEADANISVHASTKRVFLVVNFRETKKPEKFRNRFTFRGRGRYKN